MYIVIPRETTLEKQLRVIRTIEKLKGNTKKKKIQLTQNKAVKGEQRNTKMEGPNRKQIVKWWT